MFFAWLKRFTPRSLYGRAAMILLVPVVTIQLVVSVVFIQRHYEGITRQMTGTLVLELGLLLERIDTARTLDEARARADALGPPLTMRIALPVPPETGTTRAFYDLSGRIVAQTLHEALPATMAVDLAPDIRNVRMVLATAYGPVEVEVPRRRVSASNPHQLLVLMVVISALMTLIAYLFLRNQLRPIKRLARAAEAFGTGRAVPYRPTGATEVRQAGAAFLEMRERIERQIEQRTLMLSGVSHDLRTPLTRMRLGLSMLAATNADDGDEIAALERDVGDMERLVDAFLEFARHDALEDPQPSDPWAIAQDAVAAAVRGGGRVTLGPGAGAGLVPLRPLAVRRALDNLIGNALRYAGRAEVSVETGPHRTVIAVEDDGPGILPADRERAMRPFTRLDVARNQDRGPGVGLGLAIARDIAARHGGTLRLSQSARLGGLRAELVLARDGGVGAAGALP